MQLIESAQNPKIKAVRALRMRKERQKQGLFVVEGIRMVDEAIAYGEVQNLIFAENLPGKENWAEKLPPGKEVLVVPTKVFNQLADTENPQGIMAVVRKKQNNLQEIKYPEGNVLIAAGIQDPGNLGTLIRTAAAAGCALVIATRETVDAYNPKVTRSTMGAIFRIPVIQGVPAVRTVTWVKKTGLPLVVAQVSASTSCFDVDLSKNFALAVGNENRGHGGEVIDRADLLVQIPMANHTESLNAAVAGSIILYEGLRQRKKAVQARLAND